MPFVGIDPGLSRALALYNPVEGTLEVEDVPSLELSNSRLRRRRVNHYQVAAIVGRWTARYPTAAVWIEAAWPRPTDGTEADFSFGTTYRVLLGACAASLLTMELVSPQAWKRASGLTSNEDATRARASSMFPGHGALWRRKKDHGRAEAALIALHGARSGVQKYGCSRGSI